MAKPGRWADSFVNLPAGRTGRRHKTLTDGRVLRRVARAGQGRAKKDAARQEEARVRLIRDTGFSARELFELRRKKRG